MIKIETKRLLLHPISDEEMQKIIDDEKDPEMQKAMRRGPARRPFTAPSPSKPNPQNNQHPQNNSWAVETLRAIDGFLDGGFSTYFVCSFFSSAGVAP